MSKLLEKLKHGFNDCRIGHLEEYIPVNRVEEQSELCDEYI